MLMDIFSSFDPHTNYIYSSISPMLFWMLTSLSILLLHPSFWINPSRTFWMTSTSVEIMFSQATRTLGVHIKGFSLIVITLFILLITSNLLGLIPYTFSPTSHLFMTFSIGLPMWLSLIISSVFLAPKTFLASLLPAGAPAWLSPALVIIETVSIMVRPITLSFRLAANMSAGHIVLGLMGMAASSIMFSSTTTFSMLMLIQVIYTLFEIGICLIQAYIFCLLLTLYADDHPH
uniref:ATP synthase F0 subunit 6 n=1 Tax=Pilargis verrucosa TaxID=1818081 RepID=UPI0030E3AF11